MINQKHHPDEGELLNFKKKYHGRKRHEHNCNDREKTVRNI